MTLALSRTAILDTAGGHATLLSGLFTLNTTTNPAYLVVSALDRKEYTVKATGVTGSFSGNGKTLGLASIGGDGRGAGIVYSWNTATKSYVNATYGTLSQLSWTDSTSANDVTNISFFGTSNASLAQSYASNSLALSQTDASGYLGSVTFANAAATATTVGTVAATNATPDAIAAAADAMVGKAWNMDGCWVLASTIAAEAGASLPVQSTELGIQGQANGPWFVLYNGPAGGSGNWQNLVSTGDIVAFQTSATSGHITTCVSGSGSTADLVDNITYESATGGIANPANDGSSSDILISAPHLASQEFAGVAANSVVIYALDTPTVTNLVASKSLSAGGTVALTSLFSAADPNHKTITSYQVYLTSKTGMLELNGKADANTATAPASVTTLSGLTFLAGTATGADTVDIRASNGTNWGDWQSLTINVGATATTQGLHVAETYGGLSLPESVALHDLFPAGLHDI